MRVAKTDNTSDNLRTYAPRQASQGDDGTIRPILQRLSRGDSESHGSAHYAVPPLDLGARAPRKAPRWPLIVACALSAGATAGVAVAAFAWIGPAAHDAPHRQAAALDPKLVQTVSFKRDEPAPEPALPKPAAQPQQADAQAATAPDSANPHAPVDLLALWSGIPTDGAAQPVAAAADPPPAASASGDGNDEAAAEVDAPVQAKAPHRRRHHHPHTRSRVAHAHNTKIPPQASGSAQADASAPANPLQSAWQTLFGHPVAGSPPAADTRATFN